MIQNQKHMQDVILPPERSQVADVADPAEMLPSIPVT